MNRKQKLPNPKRMDAAYRGVVDEEEGWWFKNPNNDGLEEGPYDSKKEANEARSDRYHNYKVNWKIVGPICLGLE